MVICYNSNWNLTQHLQVQGSWAGQEFFRKGAWGNQISHSTLDAWNAIRCEESWTPPAGAAALACLQASVGRTHTHLYYGQYSFLVPDTCPHEMTLSIEGWLDKEMWYMSTMECYSAIKKNEIMSFAATWMQLEFSILSEVNQKEKDTMWYHLYVESKIWHKWTYLQNRNRLTDIEIRLVVAKGEGGGTGMDWDFGVGRCKLLYLEWINNKVLLYSTGNYIQSLGINNILW